MCNRRSAGRDATGIAIGNGIGIGACGAWNVYGRRVVPDGASLPTEFVERRLPAGRYACAVHVGPYEQLDDAWARLIGEWLPASGHRLGDGVSHEIYVNNPMTAAKEELRTELNVPIE